MKKNINLMQNPEDIVFDENLTYSKEYLIQALANLGQRIGIKGDGISYKSFNFNDILLNTEYYSSDDYVGFIEYMKDDYNNQIKALFGVANKLNLEVTETIDSSINIDNTLNFNSELSFSIPLCGIEKYSKNSICVNKDNELTFILAGKKIGYNDNDTNNTILMYYKFNILSNKLISCYKLYHFSNSYYCLLNVNSKTNNVYELSINIFNSTTLGDYENSFKNLFIFSNYASTANIPFTIIDKEYVNIDKLLAYNENKLDFNSAIAIILNTPKNQLYHSKTVELLFDTQKNELLSENNSELNDLISFYFNEYDLNLNEEIFYINEDINKLYVNIFNYYNEKFYLETRSTFIKRILLKLYEKSINYKEYIGKRLYIPLGYEFHYICNSNNELNIFYSNNIYVTYTSLSNVNLNEFWDENNNLIFDYEDLGKLKVYNFEINYNSYIDNLINSINIKDIYTMPYINAENNWCINDSDTKIQAVGKDAGNPNIIVIYNHDQENNYNILNAISNKETIYNATYDQRWFSLDNALFDNTYDANIECCAYIPQITNINYEYFKNSIIFSISDLDCLKYEAYKDKYKGSYILTLWNIVEDHNKLSFECIKQIDKDNALALGATVNLFNALSDSSITNLNDQDLILLKSIISNIGQERLNVNMNNWLIIKNKQSEEYDNAKTEYNNDLNMIMQYDDNVSINTNHIIHSHSSSRYISDIDNLSITNSLYPKYEYHTEEQQVTSENIPVILNTLTAQSIANSEVTVNDSTVTNIESLIEELRNIQYLGNIEHQTIKTIKTSSVNLTNNNYYEYIFNSNVPTLDFKEIFNRNFNLLNRLNVISLDNNGKIYNAFLGTSYDESDKSTLHIGTSNLNINVGSDTLMNEIDKNKFNKHDSISIDFDNIKLNANKNITVFKDITQTQTINNVTYTLSNTKLLGPCLDKILLSEGNYYINNMNSSLFASYLYSRTINGIIDEETFYYVSVNEIMKKFNINIDNYSTVNLITNNDYINLINTSYYYVRLENSVFNLGNSIIYSSDNVEIMYYEESNNVINIYLTFK